MHDHAQTPAPGIRGSSARRLLTISLAITASVMVVQVVGSALSGSLALLADAAHMFSDAAALVVALVASIVAARPADDRRTYGYRRAEVFGAMLNAGILIALAMWVAVEGTLRLVSGGGGGVEGSLMLVVALIGLAANAVALWLLGRAQRTSINVRGAYLEVLGDLIGSAAVIVAALVIVFTGWAPADALASLLIAVLIVPRAVALLREVLSVLAESAPAGVLPSEIRRHIVGEPGVRAVHDVHVWQLTRGAPVFTAHVVVDPEVWDRGGSGALLERLQACLADHFDVAHSTFQLEPAGHADRDADAHD